MTDTQNTDTDPAAGDDAPVTMGAVRALVQGMLAKKDNETGTRTAGRRVVESRLDRDSAIQDEVEKAVAQIKASEDARRERDGLNEVIKELQAKVDVPPVEKSPLHRFMGWGDK